MGSVGNIAYLFTARTCDAGAYNSGKQGAAKLRYRAAEHPTCSTCAHCIDCACFVYSSSNYSRIRTHSGVGTRNGSYRLAGWRLYYTQDSATSKQRPRSAPLSGGERQARSGRGSPARGTGNVVSEQPKRFTPGASSSRTDGVGTGRHSPLYWLAYKYWRRLVRAGSCFLKPF